MRQHNGFLGLALGIALGVVGVDASVVSAQTRRPARAQQSVTQDEILRLQDSAQEVDQTIGRLRSRDRELAIRLQDRLDEVRDEITYLRVKLRKEGTVSRDELADTRDRLEQLRAQAVGDIPDSRDQGTLGTTGTTGGSTSGRAESREVRDARPNEVPVGTELDVRLQSPLSSETSQIEDSFEATTLVDLANGGRVLVPAGSVVRGVVTAVNKAGRLDRKGRLTLKFDRMTIDRTSYPVRATVTEALESGGLKGDAAKIGAGSAVGAIIGGILGGVKGALAGVLIGGGGVVAATEGQDVDLPAGTVLRIRLDEPIVVR